MTNLTDLLPCPFCASAEVSHSWGEKGDGTPWPYVECEKCGAATEPDVWNRRDLAATPARPEPYGHVTTHRLTGQQFFYPGSDSPYLDNASACVAVYTEPVASLERVVEPMANDEKGEAK